MAAAAAGAGGGGGDPKNAGGAGGSSECTSDEGGDGIEAARTRACGARKETGCPGTGDADRAGGGGSCSAEGANAVEAGEAKPPTGSSPWVAGEAVREVTERQSSSRWR